MLDAYMPSEVALQLPVEITCLSYREASQSILAGGKTGHLYVYTPSTSRKGFDLSNICKTFRRKSVTELHICERDDILLCVSDGQLAAHRLSDDKFPVVALLLKAKSLHTFAKFLPTGSSELYILVSDKKRFYMFKWGKKGDEFDFIDVPFEYNQSFVENPTCITCIGESVFFAAKDEYYLMLIKRRSMLENEHESWTGNVRSLMTFQAIPAIVPMRDRRWMAFVRSANVVTTNYEGKRTVDCKEYKFSEAPLQLVYDQPYLVALLSRNRIEVVSASNSTRLQMMSLPKAAFVVNGFRGNVFVGAANGIWVLDTAPNLKKNVTQLLADREFDLAIQLADHSNIFSEENKTEIKKQAAFNLFQKKKFEEAFALYADIQTDVITIIKLFPDLLPEQIQKDVPLDMPANDKLRAMLALSNYLSDIRSQYAARIEKDQRQKATGERRMDTNELYKVKNALRVVDTTLLKCYLKTKPALADSLIRLPSNACAFEDAEAILKEFNRTSSLFTLYESRKKHELALKLLVEQFANPEADLRFKGLTSVVEYLQTLGNINLPLIFKYAKWVLNKDIEAGVSVFTGDDTEVARNLDRRAIVEFLRIECIDAVIPYLEYLLYKWEEHDPYFHEVLSEHYVSKVNELFKDYVHAFPDDENTTQAGEEDGDLGLYRRRLIKFLKFSNSYSPQSILMQLTSHAFYEERALILGRLKHHEQALTIYTEVLKNLDGAEKYCELYYNAHDEINSQVYLFYFCTLVQPSDPMILGFDERDIPMVSPDIHSAIKLLGRHADKINTVLALTKLPNETRLRVVATALNAVLQTKHDYATSCALQLCVSSCALAKKEAKKRAAEATKIVVDMSSDCVVCNKKIALSAFVRNTDGSLVHFYCYNDSVPERMRAVSLSVANFQPSPR